MTVLVRLSRGAKSWDGYCCFVEVVGRVLCAGFWEVGKRGSRFSYRAVQDMELRILEIALLIVR